MHGVTMKCYRVFQQNLRILRGHNAELNLSQRVVHKITIEFEVVNYSFILLVWLKSLLKTLLFKNLFTFFPIAIKDTIQQNLYFVRNLWKLNCQWYFIRAILIYPAYFPVFHMQKYVTSYSVSAHSFTVNFLNHELRWLKIY